jgi:hypothetical protein
VGRRPAATVIVELNHYKYVRKDRQRNAPTQVFCAPAVELPIEHSVAGPSFHRSRALQRPMNDRARSGTVRTAVQRDGPAVGFGDLARESEADAGPAGLRGEERDE